MNLVINKDNVSTLNFNGFEVETLIYNGIEVWKKGSEGQPSDEIWYTTSDGLTAQTTNSTGRSSLNSMGLISNTYVDGKGIMKFSKDVTSIGENAFRGCTSITSVSLPNSVITMNLTPFQDCRSLASISFGNGLTDTGRGALYNCQSLTNVELPSSLKILGQDCFGYCSSLTSITIPNSVTSIGIMALQHCVSLTSVTYNGTKAQFTSITKGSGWKLDVPTTCVVHCTNGDYPISDF